MSEITKLYRVQVYNPGSTSVVEFTWDTQLGSVPIVGSQEARPLEGLVESRPWSFKVVDVNEAVTNQLGDAGRANLLGRLVAIQADIDGAGFATIAKGRLSSLSEAQPGVYDCQVSDEGFVERGNTIFATTNTCRLYPPGLKARWSGIPAVSEFDDWLVAQVLGDDIALVVNRLPLSDNILTLLRDDIKEDSKPGGSSGGVGNFTLLRAKLNGTDRQVITFNHAIDSPDLIPEHPIGQSYRLWVSWPSSGLSRGDRVSGHLHIDGIEPSETVPLHIGGIVGVDPMQLIKDIYDLTYGGDEVVRYDSTQFTAMIGHALLPSMWFRITGPVNMAEFVGAIYKAIGVVPFINAEGEIDPQFIRLQQNVNPASLTTIGPSEATSAPTWDHSIGDLVTAVRFPYRQGSFLADIYIRTTEDRTWPADRYGFEKEVVQEFTHDNIADLGRHEITIPLAGLPNFGTVERHGRALSQDIFDRFGDGPIEGHFDTLATIDEEAGAWAVFSGLPYPSPENNDRGDARVIQIMNREVRPVGFRYRYLDGGPNSAILVAPTVAIALNGTRPKFAVDVTISALPAGTTYELQLKLGSLPWEFFRKGTANETIVVQNLPSGTTIQARARTVDPQRIRSAFSTAVSQATTALTAPSGLATNVTGRTVTLTWTNGEANEAIDITLDGVGVLNNPLKAGTTRYVFTGLAASTLFTLGVKHVDRYGGESTLTTDTDTTSTAQTLAALRALTIIQGAPATDVVHPTEYEFEAGIELSFVRTEAHAEVEIEVDDNSGFTSPDVYTALGEDRIRIVLPLNDTLQYFRARQTRFGWTASAWSSTVSAKPVPFAETASISDGFAGGYAFLSLDVDSDVILNVGTDDPDTDTAYFELNKTGFVEPTTGSSSIAESAMPYSQDQALIVADGETAYLWLKFHNSVKGFGQEVKHRITIGVISTTTFRQASPPTANNVGDIWFDSDDGDKLYRWSGAAWIEVADDDIAQALSDASAAQTTADGKNTMFRQNSAPTANATGDLWFDSNDDDRPYRWSGSSWVDIGDVTASRINVASLSAFQANLGTITAGKIDVGSIEINADTERILFGAATGPFAGMGIFMGKDGSDYEFRVGDPSGQYLWWDGTDLVIGGDVRVGDSVGIGTAPEASTALATFADSTTWAAKERNDNVAPQGHLIDFSGASPDNTASNFWRCDDSTAIKAKCTADGDVWTQDDGILTCDRSLKENIVDATPKLDDVMLLRVANFNWNAVLHPLGGENQQRTRIGYIADEVAAIFPGLVKTEMVREFLPGPYDDVLKRTTKVRAPLFKQVARTGTIGSPILVKAFQEYVVESRGEIADLKSRLATAGIA